MKTVRVSQKKYFGIDTWMAEVINVTLNMKPCGCDPVTTWRPATKDLRCIGKLKDVKKALGLKKLKNKEITISGKRHYYFEV